MFCSCSGIFFDPRCIVSICFSTSVSIVLFVLKRLIKVSSSEFVWDVWLGKYSEPNKNRFRPALTVIVLAASSVLPFFVVSTSECRLAGAGILKHCLELPVQSESLLEHAKHLRAEYDAIQQQRNKQRRYKHERERYERKSRKERYGLKRARIIQKQIQYNVAHRDHINNVEQVDPAYIRKRPLPAILLSTAA